MKRLHTIFLLIIALGVFGSFNLKAQSLQLTAYDTLINSEVGINPGLWGKVKNISTDTLHVKCKMEISKLTSGHYFTICFNGSCLTAQITSDFQSMTSVTLAPGAELNSTNGMHITLNDSGYAGTTIIRTTFYNSSNINDSASFITTFIIGTTSVKDDLYSNLVLSNAYPNPAKDNMSISYNISDMFSNASIEVYNYLGNFVNSYKLEQASGVVNLNVDALPQGKYYYMLKINGEAIKTQNFIVLR